MDFEGTELVESYGEHLVEEDREPKVRSTLTLCVL